MTDQRVENLQFLAEQGGLGLTAACERLDLSAAYAEKILRDAGRNDLMRRLRAQDYLPI